MILSFLQIRQIVAECFDICLHLVSGLEIEEIIFFTTTENNHHLSSVLHEFSPTKCSVHIEGEYKT